MTQTSATLALTSAGPEARVLADRRRHKRFDITLLGRFMRSSKHEYPCKLKDISVGGAAMMSPVEVSMGERIIAYFDHIGGIEGHVARVFEGGFAIRLTATPHKREKLAAQITWLINRDEHPVAEARRHERMVVPDKLSVLKFENGTEAECRVQDVSLSGASVMTEVRPPVGSELMLGRLRSLVVRHHDNGLGLAFIDIQEPEALRKYFG